MKTRIASILTASTLVLTSCFVMAQTPETSPATVQHTLKTKAEKEELLFIQHAKSANLYFDRATNSYNLTLQSPSEVYWFTEAPQHDFGRIETLSFNRQLHAKHGQFFKGEPNISFIYKTPGAHSKNQTVSFISLDNITTPSKHQITYSGKALKGNTTLAKLGNQHLKDVAVFVDSVSGSCLISIGSYVLICHS